MSEPGGGAPSAGAAPASAGSPIVSFNIIVEDRIPCSARRRYETQVLLLARVVLTSTLNFNFNFKF